MFMIIVYIIFVYHEGVKLRIEMDVEAENNCGYDVKNTAVPSFATNSHTDRGNMIADSILI